jgi:predicted nucleic-acid-binding protein
VIAFDTNLLVRFLVDDDPDQADVAETLMHNNTVFVSKTVLLESEWVLRSVYGHDRETLGIFFEDLLVAENLVFEAADQVNRAVQWYRLGADLADALHLAGCGDAVMHTFDRHFCKTARKAGVAPEVRVLRGRPSLGSHQDSDPSGRLE